MCSEPANVSVHPVPVDHANAEASAGDATGQPTAGPSPAGNTPQSSQQTDVFRRPTSLSLRASRSEAKAATGASTVSAKWAEIVQPSQQTGVRKKLFRSSSSNLDAKPVSSDPVAPALAPHKFQLSNELDKIFVISDIGTSNLDDSIQVIDERRMRNMPKSDRARLYKSNTIICEEYYKGETIVDFIDADKDADGETVDEVAPEKQSGSSSK